MTFGLWRCRAPGPIIHSVNNEAPAKLLIAAGLITWATVTGGVLYIVFRSETYGHLWPYVALLALLVLAFGAVAVGMERGNGKPGLGLAALALAATTALSMGLLVPISFLPIYTIVLIAILPSYVSLPICLAVLVVVMALWSLVMGWHWGQVEALLSIALQGTFHLFALLSANSTRVAEAAEQRTAALNRELAATQHLLSEAARQSERTRIARDLHDLVGHHLTALTINLQIAERLTEGDAADRIRQSHALARLLLADVRDAVSTMRDASAVDFEAALRLMVDRVPRLNVSLELDPAVKIDDVAIAEPLLRCVQEALTNTLRHSSARNTTIRMTRENDTIALSVVDDGGSNTEPDVGHGLAGMRERIEQIRGALTVERTERSFSIHVRVPATL